MVESKTMPMLISAFLCLIVGLAFVTTIATETNDVTEQINIVDELFTMVEASWVNKTANVTINTSYVYTIDSDNIPTNWRITDCPISGITVSNSTTDYTVTTDYVFNTTAGTFTLVNTTAVVNGSFTGLMYADYTYCPSEYLNQGWQRTVLDLVSGFFAIGLLGIAIALFYGVMKQEGILNI